MKRKRANCDEQDLFSRYWRRVVHWRRGEKSKIRRNCHKRERQEGKREARDQT